MGFIGYAVQRGMGPGQVLVRIFLNCDEKPLAELPTIPEPVTLRPPEAIHFLHAVDVVFDHKGDRCRFRGLDTISAVRKFNRLLGSLDERAREHNRDPNTMFRSSDEFLAVLARVKNVRQFSPDIPGLFLSG